MNHTYRKVTTITCNNKLFQVFKDERSRYAFLEIDDNNKYQYPKLKDLIILIDIFSNRPKGIVFMEKKMPKRPLRYKIAISALLVTNVIACSSILYKEISERTGIDYNNIEDTISISDDYDVVKDSSNIKLYEGEDKEVEIIIDETIDDVIIEDNELAESIVDLSNGYQLPKEYKDTSTSIDKAYVDYSDMEVVVYDTIALDKYFGNKQPTIQEINNAIDSNGDIPTDFKSFFKDFAKDIIDYYPGIDMRIFYNNIESMKIKYITEENHIDQNAEAWYDYFHNTMYVNKNMDFKNNKHDLIVIRHEACHSLNLTRKFVSNKLVFHSMENLNYGHYIQEGANVVLSKYPYQNEYAEDENLGLPLISNELELILEATPGFDPRDLVSKNINYLENLLDNNNNCSIRAQELFDVMEIQTQEYYDGRFKGNKVDYEKIYRYIGEVYVNNVFNDNMSKEEIEQYREYLNYELTKCLVNTDLVRLDALNNVIDNYLSERNTKTK